MAELAPDFLERLTRTKGDPHAQAALAAEFALTTRPPAEHPPLRAALDAAAVLHWFDANLLARMLERPEADVARLVEALKSFTFVERYRRGAGHLHNVHEATRLGWRKRLAAEQPARFRELSARAAACFADNPGEW